MPIYQYKCISCEKEFKLLHSIDEQNIECKFCNSNKLEKCLPKLTVSTPNFSATTAGDRVERFIEDSRETLKQQLSEARKELKI